MPANTLPSPAARARFKIGLRAPAALQRLKDDGSVRIQLENVLRSPLGWLLAKPWFDWAFLRLLTGALLPTARLFAAAEANGFDAERLIADHPAIRDRVALPELREHLAALARLRVPMAETEAATRAATRGDVPVTEIAAADRARRGAAADYLLARAKLFHAARPVPPVAFATPDEAALAAWLAPWHDRPEALFAAPDPMPAVHASPAFPLGGGSVTRLLQFDSPAPWLEGPVLARVYEPAGAVDPPTYIHCHGIGIESDQMPEGAEEILGLVGRGVRVVRLVAPWHGRRRPIGQWSGERFLATAPLGAIEFFAAVARELAVLTHWARANSKGRVAIGGISLGALSAQIAAARATGWPASLRPDALLLIGTSSPLDRIAYDGALTRRLGVGRALAARDWTPERLAPWQRFTDPAEPPAVDPAAIVMVLGRVDDVTPYAGGAALAERWQVPARNRFVRWQGHFTVELGLIPDDTPLKRMAEIMRHGG